MSATTCKLQCSLLSMDNYVNNFWVAIDLFQTYILYLSKLCMHSLKFQITQNLILEKESPPASELLSRDSVSQFS